MLRELFPAIHTAAETFLDSAATTQKPQPVIDTLTRYHSRQTANIARGSYPWTTALTQEIAEIRRRTAAFLGAAHSDEIVFTSGATAALHTVAWSWGLDNLQSGDQILYSPRDHAANVFPWLQLRQMLARCGTSIDLVPYELTATGSVDLDDIAAKIGPRTRCVTLSHLHHVFGARSTLAGLRETLPEQVVVCFDCSQSGGHLPVDVSALGADFAVFATHKMFGSPGTGVLYCRRRLHARLRPFLAGGNTAVTVQENDLLAGDMPQRLEGGTPDIGGILAWGSALQVLRDIGLDTIAAHNRHLTQRVVAGLRTVRGVEFTPGPGMGAGEDGYGIVSFRVAGISAMDLGFVLSQHGFLVRAGTHCVPGVQEDSVRVSTHIYNSAAEIDEFVGCVRALAEEMP